MKITLFKTISDIIINYDIIFNLKIRYSVQNTIFKYIYDIYSIKNYDFENCIYYIQFISPMLKIIYDIQNCIRYTFNTKLLYSKYIRYIKFRMIYKSIYDILFNSQLRYSQHIQNIVHYKIYTIYSCNNYLLFFNRI